MGSALPRAQPAGAGPGRCGRAPRLARLSNSYRYLPLPTVTDRHRPSPTITDRHPLPIVLSGFSSCAHAYVVSAEGLRRLTALPISAAALPTDDLLPALYSPHPRDDVRQWATGVCASSGGPLRALAFRDDLIWQLESVATGSGTEAMQGASTGGEIVGPMGGGSSAIGSGGRQTATSLSRSNIRPGSLASCAAPARAPRLRQRVGMVGRQSGLGAVSAIGRRMGGGGGEANAVGVPAIFGDSWPLPDCPLPESPLVAAWGDRHTKAEEYSACDASDARGSAGSSAPLLCASRRWKGRWCALPPWAWLYAAAASGAEGIDVLRVVSRGMRALLDEMQVRVLGGGVGVGPGACLLGARTLLNDNPTTSGAA